MRMLLNTASSPAAGPELERALAVVLEQSHAGRRIVSLVRHAPFEPVPADAPRQGAGHGVAVATEQTTRRALSGSPSIELLDLLLDDGTPLHLVLKTVSWASLTVEARRNKPSFLCEPSREPEVYRRILGPLTPGTPVFYGSAIWRGGAQHWLFLEKVDGQRLSDTDPLAHPGSWVAVAAWLGAMHARCEPYADDLPQVAPLLICGTDYHHMWMRRTCDFFLRGRAAPQDIARRIMYLAGQYLGVVDYLSALPCTLVHGDCSPANVLVAPEQELRVCPVDWELAGVAPGMMDLAELTASAPDELREAMASAYRDAYVRHGGRRRGERLHDDLLACRLARIVRKLGFARPQWDQPDAVRALVAEAIDLADQLGI